MNNEPQRTDTERLDFLQRMIGTPLTAQALDLAYHECFPLRDAIDLAMKREATNP